MTRRTAFVTGASQGIGAAEEVAGAVSYLASPAAAYMTGQTGGAYFS
jgi:NAD(P)-dependent dehydrogenase (short-subunit alcohol dehydrogenase family)